MSDVKVMPTPDLSEYLPTETNWESERRAFLEMHNSLLKTHRGKYVAIHRGRVVESGEDKVALALLAYERHGYVPIYVGLVTDKPRPPVRIPSPRLRRNLRTR